MSEFKAKMHQNRFRLGLCPRPRWGSLPQLSPRSPSWSKGALILREGRGTRKGRGKEGEGNRRGERKEKGEGRQERGKGKGRERGREEEKRERGEVTRHTNPTLLPAPLTTRALVEQRNPPR